MFILLTVYLIEQSFLCCFGVLFTCLVFWLGWVFVAVPGVSLVAVTGASLELQCMGFSFSVASLVAEHWLWDARLNNCSIWAQLPWGLWNLPRPGIEPMSPLLIGRFLTAGPPGKSQSKVFNFNKVQFIFFFLSGVILLILYLKRYH